MSSPTLGYLLDTQTKRAGPLSKPSDDDAFALNRMRNYAGWLSFDAKNLTQDAKSVVSWAAKITTQRPFETMAEDALDNAEKALTHALESLRSARERYKSLPASPKPAVVRKG